MKVSTKGRYAISVMLDLAVNNTGEYIPLKDVSERQGITLKYLEQIIILGAGAMRLSARAFREEVDAAEKAIRSYLAGEE